jgi:hypothetical protein
MATYPSKREEFLKWCEAHVNVFADNFAAIGVPQATAAAFTAQVEELRVKTTQQTSARDAAKAATEAVTDSDGDTRQLASNIVRLIRTYAITTNNPAVYELAQIPAPSTGGVVPPPGRPTDFKVELNPEGSITFRWKATHPEGSDRVVYFVQRKLITETAFRLVGGTGERAYTDDTLPFGVDGVQYIVTAQRGQVQGQASLPLGIFFGSVGGRGGGVRIVEGEIADVSKKQAA